jgi:hypothetical protein
LPLFAPPPLGVVVGVVCGVVWSAIDVDVDTYVLLADPSAPAARLPVLAALVNLGPGPALFARPRTDPLDDPTDARLDRRRTGRSS